MAEQNLYLGIDGGGTKTKIIIINDNKEKVFEVTTGPSSIDTVSLDEMYKNILSGYEKFENIKKLNIKSVFAGIGGIVFPADKEKVVQILKSLPNLSKDASIIVENDMYNALASGLLFKEGATLICGTGMVAFAKDKSGKTAKSAGWGFKEGEMGSGFSLGMEAIRYMVRAFDGRLIKDEFAIEVSSEIGLNKIEDIIPIMDKLYLDRTKVASLSPIVTKYADRNHYYANKIINTATDEIALAIKAVFKNTNIENKKIVIVGGLGNAEGSFKNLLHEKIKNINENIEILAPKVDPAYAAALIALKNKGGF